MATVKAPKGGAFGANGEWYEGGKFINSIPENSKREGSSPKRKPSKREIEPYVWVVTERRPLFANCGAGAIYNRNTKTMAPYAPAFRFQGGAAMFNGTTLAEIQTYCDAYNAGKRYCDEV